MTRKYYFLQRSRYPLKILTKMCYKFYFNGAKYYGFGSNRKKNGIKKLSQVSLPVHINLHVVSCMLQSFFVNFLNLSCCIISVVVIFGSVILCWFLTNELRVTSYELRVIIYCSSYELIFTYELRVITYCMSYELIFIYDLRITIYCTSYKWKLSYELRVHIYCTSWDCNVDYVKFLYYTSCSFLWPALCKIEYS